MTARISLILRKALLQTHAGHECRLVGLAPYSDARFIVSVEPGASLLVPTKFCFRIQFEILAWLREVESFYEFIRPNQSAGFASTPTNWDVFNRF
jgi:hypothetical protein